MMIKSLTRNADNWPQLCTNHQSSNMNTQQNMEDRLWDFIDRRSNDEERSQIEKLIAENIEWQRKYRELLEVHRLMNSAELEAPSMRFTKNVMEEIAKYRVAPAAKSYINKKIIWGIGGFFVVMILGLLVYGFAHVNWSAGSSSGSIIPQQDLDRLDKIDWGKFFNNTYTSVFMMINVVIGLVLLDMYLRRKKQGSEHKEA